MRLPVRRHSFLEAAPLFPILNIHGAVEKNTTDKCAIRPSAKQEMGQTT